MKKLFDKLYSKSAESFYNILNKNMKNEKRMFIVTANPETFMKSETDEELKKILEDKETILVPDGIGIVKASRMIGYDIKERIAGIDIAVKLLELGNEEKKTAYLFGSKQEVIDSMNKVIKEKYPNLKVAGTTNGYVKDKLDYHKLVIDEYSASVVKKIFNLFLKGNSISSICRTLTNKKIPIPSIYKNLNRGLKSTCYGEWTNRTVTDILTNPTYIGNLTQGRLRKVNYKSKKIIHTKKEDWIIVENSCPKIIEENVFNQVQNIFNCNKNKTRKTQDILLKGLVRCKECNHTIGFRKQKIIRKKDTVYKIYGNCNYYLKHRYSNICTPHNIKYEELENIITKVIDVIINNIDKEKLKAKLDKYLNKKNDNYDNSNKIKKIKKEIDNNLKKIDKVYLDKIDNIIDNKMYERIYNTIMDINKRNEEEIKLLMKKDNSNKNINSKELINKYIKINKNLLCTIIDYINIDKDKNIEIYFNYLN